MRVRLKSNGNYWQAYSSHHGTRSLGAKANVSKRRAEQLCRQWEFELRFAALAPVTASTDAPARAHTLSTWLETCEQQRTKLAKGTRYVNRACGIYLKRHFKSDPAIKSITREDAENWRAALARGELSKDNARHTDAPSETSVCKYVRAARKIFAVAAKQDLIKANPFDQLDGTAPDVDKEWAYIDAGQMARVLDACPDVFWRACFGLCRFAGLRRDEALRLRLIDVDLSTNEIHVNAPGTIVSRTNKKRPRKVPIEAAKLPTGLTAILQLAYDAAPEGATRVCHSVPRHNANAPGAEIIKAAGIAQYAKLFHTLRKNWEQDCAAVYPQHVVAEWAGHSIEVSATHYLRVPQELYQPPAAMKPKAQAAQTTHPTP